ncbi:hypothetical protein Ddye_010453 [Dipteronia dyeriana]|uniref:RPW8 domain-containing protein n=1 Tax=Dipteronia dyeriana TaxID=168575 RepID=A0AAE0CNA7_9ROSI|nr:hypothetical protein Ddye_010453 [Dipteronia dyeriana]
MAADTVGGAFLGAVFGEVLRLVTDSIRKSHKFKPELEKLKSTLESITPIIQEIVKLNENLDRPKQETEKLIGLLRDAEELIHKCSKQKKWNSVKKIIRADDLIKLNESIKDYCIVVLQVQSIRNGKEVLERLNKISSGNEQVGGVFNGVKNDEIYGPCSVPDLREKTPGLDAPMKELRTELLKDDGMQVIVVSAPGGAGKTTLVKKLCADDKVKDKFQENIFFVTVSEKPDVMVIIKKILQHKKKEVLPFQTEESALNDLGRLLKSIGQAILLVLDDVWKE